MTYSTILKLLCLPPPTLKVSFEVDLMKHLVVSERSKERGSGG